MLAAKCMSLTGIRVQTIKLMHILLVFDDSFFHIHFVADDNCFNFDCSIKKPTSFLPFRPPQKIWLYLLLNADHF